MTLVAGRAEASARPEPATAADPPSPRPPARRGRRSNAAQYLNEVLSLLYPGARDGLGTVRAEYFAIPGARRPRLLVPAPRRLAALAARHHAKPQRRFARIRRDLAVAALRTGISRVLLHRRVRIAGATDSIDAYLQRALARQLSVSVQIGPARPSRKPVLQLITSDGETLGFAKVAMSDLTERLVHTEAVALTMLSQVPLARVRPPRVLHSGHWRGHEVLVQEALPTWLTHRPSPDWTLAAAMREVAFCLGSTRGRVSASGYWRSLLGRLSGESGDDDQPAESVALAAAARRLIGQCGDVELVFGTWHGDWAPWHMAAYCDTTLLWDWERFGAGVPVGFDALHYDLQVRLERGQEPELAVAATVSRAADLLLPFRVHGRESVGTTAGFYLVDLASRYLTERRAGSGLGGFGDVLLPVLLARVEAL